MTFAVLGGLATACGNGDVAPGHQAEKPKIRIGWEKTTADASLYYMKELGAERGIDVQLTEFPRHPDIKTALLNGSIDFGSVTAPDLIYSLDSGSDAIRVLAGEGRGGDYLQCRSGVNPTTWKELENSKLRIRTFAGGIAWLKLMVSLSDNHVDTNKLAMEKIAGGPPDMAILIKTKQAEIATNVDPFVARGKLQGDSDYCNLDINKSRMGSVNALFSGRTDFVKTDAGVTEQVLSLYLDSVKKLSTDHALWARVYEEYSGLSDDVAKQAIKKVELDVAVPEENLQFAASFMHENGLVKTDVSDKLDAALNYDVLAKLTGRTADDLGRAPA
jgi:ABC-type nitrate/sulfonate/bicarbonate transport system substrate-binding protein